MRAFPLACVAGRGGGMEGGTVKTEPAHVPVVGPQSVWTDLCRLCIEKAGHTPIPALSKVTAYRGTITLPGNDPIEGPFCASPEEAFEAAAQRALAHYGSVVGQHPHMGHFPLYLAANPDKIGASAETNAKTALQEHYMARGGTLPTYTTVRSGGTDNAPIWDCTIEVPGEPKSFIHGIIGSKKAAELTAARVRCDAYGIAHKRSL